MDGQKEVKMLNGSWEMVWMEGSPSGAKWHHTVIFYCTVKMDSD